MARWLPSACLALLLAVPSAAEPAQDHDGEPLPDGAIARLGSLNFRPAHSRWGRLSVAVSPDGKTLAVGEYHGVRLFDIETGKQTGFIPVSASGGVLDVTFAPDGRRIAIVADNLFAISRPWFNDMSIYVADVAKGKVLWKSKEFMQERFAYCSPCFAAGGKIVLAHRGYDSPLNHGSVFAFDAETGTTKWWHNDVASFAVSPDGKALAYGRADGHVVLIDVATDKEQNLWRALDSPVAALAWSPDGKLLATGGGHERMQQPDAPAKIDRRVRVWDVKSAKEKFTAKIDSEAARVAFSPDGRLLEACNRARARIWELEKGTQVWTDTEKETPISQSKTLSDGTALRFDIVPALGYRVRVRLLKPDKTELWSWLASGAALSPSEAVVTPDGLRYVTAGSGLRITDPATGKDLIDNAGHRLPLRNLSVSPDGAFVISTDEKHNARVWKLADASLLPGVDGPQAGIRFVDGGKRVASITFDGNVRLREAATNKLVKAFKIKECFHPAVWKEGYVNEQPAFDFSADGRLVAVQSVKAVEVWDVPKGERVARHEDFPDPVTRLAFAPDGRFLLAEIRKKELRLCEPAGKEIGRWPLGDGFGEGYSRFSPDSRWLAWAGPRTLNVWDLKAEKIAHKLGGSCYDFAFAGDSSSIATFEPGNFVRLWQLPGGAEVRVLAPDDARWKQTHARFIATPGGVTAEVSLDPKHSSWSLVDIGTGRTIIPQIGSFSQRAFSTDGRIVAVGEHQVGLYETATGKEICRLPHGHRGEVAALAFAPDGETLLTGGSEGTILVWDWPGVCGMTPREGRLPIDLWKDLRSDEASTGYRAIFALRDDPAKSVVMLREHLKSAGDEDARRIRRLVLALDDDNFRERDAAAKELRKLGVEAEPFLREALAGKLSAEAEKRVKALLDDPEIGRIHPETVRAIRAIQVLEGIDTDEARAFLRELAKGDPRMVITREARRTARP